MTFFGARSARILLTAAIVFAIDQASKAAAVARLSPGERAEILPFLDLERTSNSGIAFGLAGDLPPVLLMGVAAAVVVVLLIIGSRIRWRGAVLAIGLILGGALGNLADRATRGAVVDFISLPHWPTFNLADAAITLGVALLALGALRSNAGR